MNFTDDDVLKLAVPLIKKWEGFRSKPYLCTAGVPTIGYGSTFYEDGTKVKITDAPIDEKRALVLLNLTLNKIFFPAVKRLCPTLDTPSKVAAILSWTYNLGEANLSSSTLCKKIQSKDWKAAAEELVKWNKSKGKVDLGLENRRADEVKMFCS